MVYNPINTQAFTAAFSGAVSGMAVNGWITSPTGSNYTLVCNVAGAFAQAFDVAWNDATALNGLEYSAIQQACAQEFSLRGPGPLASSKFSDPANWAVPAKACATLALQCDLYFAGQGITPPSLGGGGQLFLQVQTSGEVDAPNPPPSSGTLTLTLFNFLLDPPVFRTGAQVTVNGFVSLFGGAGDETPATYAGTLFTELSFDNGLSWLPTMAPSPYNWSFTGQTGGTNSMAYNVPLVSQISGQDITDDLLWRVTLAMTDGPGTGSVSGQVYASYMIGQAFPS